MRPLLQMLMTPLPTASYARMKNILLHLCQFQHDKMISTLKENKFCINCLKPGHFVKQCKSLHRCRKCQKLHHTLLHVDTEQGSQTTPVSSTPVSTNPTPTSVSSHTAAGLSSNTLLMTCLSHGSPLWSIASVKVSSTRSPGKQLSRA